MDEQREREPSDADKLNAFYQKLTVVLIRLAKRTGLRPARAKDVAQSVWLKFFQRHPVFAGDHGHEQERSWLLRVARREIANLFRANHRHRSLSLDALAEEPMDYRGQESTNREDGVLVRFRTWLEERRLTNPRNYRLVYGHYIEEIDAATLAGETGLTTNQVYCRIHTEIQKFRTWLSHQPDED